jgi:hypothetical protein
MDFWKAILGLIRRKYIGLPILGVAVLVAGLAYLLTPARYVSNTTMVLTTPTSGGTLSQDPTKPTGLTNPLLNFDDGLKTTSVILIQSMNTPEVHKELGLDGGGTKLVVDDGSSNATLIGVQGPFLYIEAESGSADAARSVVAAAQQRVRDELLNRQKALGAPPTTYITMVDVVPPSTPQVNRADQLQIAAAGFVLVFLGGILGAYGAERLFGSRRRKLADPQPAPPSPTPRPLDAATERFAPVTNGTPVPVNGAQVPDEVRAP